MPQRLVEKNGVMCSYHMTLLDLALRSSGWLLATRHTLSGLSRPCKAVS
jgi:hypothetical protein